MRIIDLALKDLMQMTRDKRSFILSLAMPIIFILVFGTIFGGGDGEESDPRLPLGFINQDGGQLSAELVTWLERSDVVQLVRDEETDLAAMQAQVAEGQLAGVLVIPTGYSQALLAGEVLPLQVILDPNNTSSTTIKQAVLLAATRVHSVVQAAHTSVSAYERQQAFPNAASRQAYFESALARALEAWQSPPIQTRQTATGQAPAGSSEEAALSENAFAQSSPGMMMQFAIAGLISAAEVIVLERRSRALQRLLTTSISRMGILLGHFLAIFAMNFIQFLVIVLFGQLFLNLNYMAAPLASVLMIAAIAMVMGGMGLLIGALSKTAENAVVLSLIPMFIFSALGGAWVPLEFTSETVQFIGHFSPVAWGMDGLKNILIRGQGLEAVWLPAGMLVLMTAIFFGLAVWRFEFEQA